MLEANRGRLKLFCAEHLADVIPAPILEVRIGRPFVEVIGYARDAEIDLIVEAGDTVRGVETKSGATIAADFLRHLHAFGQALKEQFPHLQTDLRLVHGGTQKGRMSNVQLVPWGDIHTFDW